MNYPTLPHYKKDRVPNTLYLLAGCLRYWTGTELLCEHKQGVNTCQQCKLVKQSTNKIPIQKKAQVVQKVQKAQGQQKTQEIQKGEAIPVQKPQKTPIKKKQVSQLKQSPQKAELFKANKPIAKVSSPEEPTQVPTAQLTAEFNELEQPVDPESTFMVPTYSGSLQSNGWASLMVPAVQTKLIPGMTSNDVGKNYRIAQKIGAGSFGAVYLGAETKTLMRVAMKIEFRNSKYPQLLDEFATLKDLAPHPGLPTAYWCGSNSNVHIMVMQYLGSSLASVFNARNNKLELAEILSIAIQVINILEYVHGKGYINRDLKPDNLVLGPPIYLQQKVYMIDFGIAKKYMLEGKHIPMKTNTKGVGTPRYMSLAVQSGSAWGSRRDDLESLGYILIELFIGRLPWQGIKAKNIQEKNEKTIAMKSQPLEEMCKDCPSFVLTYMKSVRGLGFKQQPNYSYLKSLFVP